MANIVFLLGEYYPNFSATSKCADNVIREIKNKHKVSVICYDDLSNLREHDNINIIGIATPLMKLKNWINHRYGAKTRGRKSILTFVNFILRLIGFLGFIFKKNSVNSSMVRKYYSAIKLCDSKEKIDVIIPICFPFEGLIAAYQFKKNNNTISMIPYLFDPFTDNETLHRFSWLKKLRYKRHEKLEKEIYKYSDKIIIINHILKSPIFMQNNTFNNKLVVTEHPVLMNPKQSINNDGKSNVVNLTYTGALYSNIRRPTYFMEMLKLINSKIGFQMNMYSFGDCEGILNGYQKDFNDKLVLHGKVPFADAQLAINNADILISIGNTIKNQTPSKIFEYISFGKPIVHIYSHNEDIVVDTLKKYPLSLCIKQDKNNINENSSRLLMFCKENAGKRIPFKQCMELYYDATPKFVANQIDSFIKKKTE